MKFLEVADLYKKYLSADVNREIHPADRMYHTNRGDTFYDTVGMGGLDCVISALTLTKLEKVNRVLDLACGYGRVARHLRAAFPEAEMFYSEVNKEAADFCANTFGGTPHYSLPEMTQADVPSEMDVIWIGSLFTHLSRTKTLNWLTYLAGRLSPHGVLVATFHGYFSAANTDFGPAATKVLRKQFDATGYGFWEYPKGEGIPEGEFGVSLSKPSAIVDMANSIPGTRVLAYTERGWSYNHDVLTLCKDDHVKPWGAP